MLGAGQEPGVQALAAERVWVVAQVVVSGAAAAEVAAARAELERRAAAARDDSRCRVVASAWAAHCCAAVADCWAYPGGCLCCWVGPDDCSCCLAQWGGCKSRAQRLPAEQQCAVACRPVSLKLRFAACRGFGCRQTGGPSVPAGVSQPAQQQGGHGSHASRQLLPDAAAR